jgi:hypothetical protein
MKIRNIFSILAFAHTVGVAPVWALSSPQIGPSGQTYASGTLQCALNPTAGMSPMVQAGLYNPKKNTSATVLENGARFASVTFLSPDATVWLSNGPNTVFVSILKGPSDSYSFDATPSTSWNQPNVCIPDTRGNTLNGDLEYAMSSKSYATVTAGCALNPASGQAQPYVNLFDNGTYVLNVSVNNTPLTQLGSRRKSTPVFLVPGWNLITAANGTLSTDTYVRDGGTGICTLP